MPKLYREAKTEEERMTATIVKLVIRDVQAERDAEAWSKVRDWLDSYRITTEHFRTWTSNPSHVERLAEECTRALYNAIQDAIDTNPQ
jgi:hypothetical protein